MKRKICLLGIVLALAMNSIPTAVYGTEEKAGIRFSEDKEFVYDDMELKAFENMEPGEKATQIIQLVNEYGDDMDFFLSQETLEEIKQANGASGGSFHYTIEVGTQEDGSDAVSLLDREVGGTSFDGTDLDAFTGMDDLKEYTYLCKLAKGESSYIFLSLEIDGEGNDNRRTFEEEEREGNLYGYSNFLATLSFSFRAYDGDKVIIDDPEPTVIDRIKEITKNNPYKGGDTSEKVLYTVVMAVGLGVVIIALILVIKRKEAKKDE